jgi:NADPH:quinone reductase-like Zn-dependent oxidoreductase
VPWIRIGKPFIDDHAACAQLVREGVPEALSFATFSTDTVPAPDRRAVRTSQFAAAGRGELDLVVHEVLPFEQAVLAHQKMDAGKVFGRIALVPSGARGRVLRTA